MSSAGNALLSFLIRIITHTAYFCLSTYCSAQYYDEIRPNVLEFYRKIVYNRNIKMAFCGIRKKGA